MDINKFFEGKIVSKNRVGQSGADLVPTVRFLEGINGKGQSR